jgi:hypothetical protein
VDRFVSAPRGAASFASRSRGLAGRVGVITSHARDAAAATRSTALYRASVVVVVVDGGVGVARA